jgi:hypothetical protein
MSYKGVQDGLPGSRARFVLVFGLCYFAGAAMRACDGDSFLALPLFNFIWLVDNDAMGSGSRQVGIQNLIFFRKVG